VPCHTERSTLKNFIYTQKQDIRLLKQNINTGNSLAKHPARHSYCSKQSLHLCSNTTGATQLAQPLDFSKKNDLTARICSQVIFFK
jgi:hypothetical protein